MDIRATVERGITTLAYQTGLSTLRFFSNHDGRHTYNDAGVGELWTIPESVDAVSSPPSIRVPAQREEEPERCNFDDEDNDARIEERDTDKDVDHRNITREDVV